MIQTTYLILCIAGTILPYSQFVPFLAEHGLNLQLFCEQLFVNRISSFFGMDLVVSSLALWTFVFWERSRLEMKNLWVYIASNLLVGVLTQEALLLTILGFLPGFAFSFGLYQVTYAATLLPVSMTLDRAVTVLVLTIIMCSVSGAIAMRKLRSADPADVF